MIELPLQLKENGRVDEETSKVVDVGIRSVVGGGG